MLKLVVVTVSCRMPNNAWYALPHVYAGGTSTQMQALVDMAEYREDAHETLDHMKQRWLVLRDKRAKMLQDARKSGPSSAQTDSLVDMWYALEALRGRIDQVRNSKDTQGERLFGSLWVPIYPTSHFITRSALAKANRQVQ